MKKIAYVGLDYHRDCRKTLASSFPASSLNRKRLILNNAEIVRIQHLDFFDSLISIHFSLP
jgi:hypothetical protein